MAAEVICLLLTEHLPVFKIQREKVRLMTAKATTDLYPTPDLIRRNFVDPAFVDLRRELEAIDLEERRRFLNDDVDLKGYADDLSQVAQLVEQMVFLHLGTGRDDAAQLAIDGVEKLMAFSKWDYFLEGGRIPVGVMRAPQGNLAVSLVLEYLGERLPSATRIRWIRTMAAKGTELCYNALQGMRYPDQVEGWSIDPDSTYFETRPEHRELDLSNWPRIFNRNNLRAVPTNGLMTGAVTYLRVFGPDDDTTRWLEQARNSFNTLGSLYAADGSYDEGVSYSGYTSTQMADLVRHFEWMDGTDHFDCVNWKGNATYLQEMTAPTQEKPARIVSFSDGPVAPKPGVSMWVARRLQDPVVQWYALNRTEPAEVRALLRYDPDLHPREPVAGPSLYRTDFDWIVARGGYRVDDLVCALRSGPPSNHEHADRNALFLKCWGEILLPDPAPVPYSVGQESWPMRFTSAHNAILIDGKGHQYIDGSEGTNASEAHAHLVQVAETDSRMQWSSDATQAYQMVNSDVAAVVRTVLVLPRVPLVVVADKVSKQKLPSTIQTRFLVWNEDGQAVAETGAGSFSIHRPAARLEALVLSENPSTVATRTLDVEEEKARAFPVIEVSSAASLNPHLVTVLLPVQSGHETPGIESRVIARSRYEIVMDAESGRVVIRIDLAGPVPVIEVDA